MNERILITGINGQDGSYLAEHCLLLGHEVHGIIRRNSIAENQQSRIDHIRDKIHVYYGDVTDTASINDIIQHVKPTQIYNLAAQSHVRISFDVPYFTLQTNAIGAFNVLDAYKRYVPEAKYYQASSSEMFGLSVDYDWFQRESTPMNPVSPYGVAKVCAYNMVRHYRRAYKLHCCNGILFNHESPRRATNFVSAKVVKTACQIKLGKATKLELGNMDSKRDWGHSYDYVRAMYLITNFKHPGDYVVSTMETHSVRDMCQFAFEYLGLNYEDYVVQNPKYLRPEELPYLKGDSTLIRTALGWKPKYTFKETIQEMCDYWIKMV